MASEAPLSHGVPSESTDSQRLCFGIGLKSTLAFAELLPPKPGEEKWHMETREMPSMHRMMLKFKMVKASRLQDLGCLPQHVQLTLNFHEGATSLARYGCFNPPAWTPLDPFKHFWAFLHMSCMHCQTKLAPACLGTHTFTRWVLVADGKAAVAAKSVISYSVSMVFWHAKGGSHSASMVGRHHSIDRFLEALAGWSATRRRRLAIGSLTSGWNNVEHGIWMEWPASSFPMIDAIKHPGLATLLSATLSYSTLTNATLDDSILSYSCYSTPSYCRYSQPLSATLASLPSATLLSATLASLLSTTLLSATLTYSSYSTPS